MGSIPGIEQNYQYGQYEKFAKVPFASLTAPKVGTSSPINGETGISIPHNHSFTTDVDGTKVSMGQDGVGLAHRNKDDHGFMLIA